VPRGHSVESTLYESVRSCAKFLDEGTDTSSEPRDGVQAHLVDFYPKLTRPNVSVVTDGIARVGALGIHTRDGAFRAADVIILATGFQVGDAGMPFPIYGQDGIELNRV